MENTKIIKINTSTKVMYSLYNYFAPITFVTVCISVFDAKGLMGTFLGFLGALVGLFCLIFNLVKYNHFLYVNEKELSICKGKVKAPKIVKIIKMEDLIRNKIDNNLFFKFENKKIKLLNTSFSLIGLLCFVGPLIFIPLMKIANTSSNILAEISEFNSELVNFQIKKPTKTDNFIANVLAWLFVLFVSGIGIIGLLLMPLYFILD